MLSKPVDAWSQTIDLLSVLSGLSGKSSCEIPRARTRVWQSGRSRNDWSGLKVRVTSRPSSTTVTLNWCHTNSCFYGDQLWRFSIARTGGICALSGRKIFRGDAVYHPRRGSYHPLNADAMILAKYIEEDNKVPLSTDMDSF